MITNIRRSIANHLLNHKGWNTDRKIVVIESDDWGSIRMPSVSVYETLLNNGVPVNKSPYCRYDTLADEEDLCALYEVLSAFKDSMGNHPVITANTLVANPDFQRIRESGFSEYHFETIEKTFQRYPGRTNCLTLWKEGIDAGLFFPQSHGKAHLNVNYWLKLLRQGEYDYRLAFENGCWGLSGDVYPGMPRSVQAALDHEDECEIDDLKELLRVGLDLFEEFFGYRSESFIANNFIWSSKLDEVLMQGGVRYLQGMKYQKLPVKYGVERKMIRHYLGEYNSCGQVYLVRNCQFEPSLKHHSLNCVDECLREIKNAFFWNKPAIISIHRINFVGALHSENRDCNLGMFRDLLKKITFQWPEVEFMTSNRLGREIKEDRKWKG